MNKITTIRCGYVLAAGVALAMALCGCEGGDDSSSGTANVNIAGTWTIVWNADAEPRNILIVESATFTQDGTSVAGSGIGVRNGVVSAQTTITGTISGDTFSFEMVWNGSHGTGSVTIVLDTFNGQGYADWDNSSGYFTGVRK